MYLVAKQTLKADSGCNDCIAMDYLMDHSVRKIKSVYYVAIQDKEIDSSKVARYMLIVCKKP